MELPEKYKWLHEIGTLPKLVSAALQYLGVAEIPGVNSNPVIMDMAKGLGVSDIYTNDDLSWCAIFINHLLRITGKPINLHPHDRYDLLRAMRTADLFTNINKADWILGDVIILKREGGGHVFIAIAKTPNGNIIGIGGNQGNKVSFAEFSQDRIIAVKRHYSVAPPESAKQYIVDSSGQLSTNEA